MEAIFKNARAALFQMGSRLWDIMAWRKLIPPLRPLTKRGPRASQFEYDAFLSYSQAADSRFAPFLQAAVQRFARPWYRLRTVRIFRDATGLTLTPELWPDIEKALDASRAFILLAAPAATQSKWVQQELAHWIKLKRAAPLIVLTEGEIRWNRNVNDFDWEKTTSLPRLLAGLFRTEPKYLDATKLKSVDLSARNPKIQNAAAEIYSRLTGRPFDEVIGEDVRQYRRNRGWAIGALGAIIVLVGGYLLQRSETGRQAAIANARQQLELARSAAQLSLQSSGGPAALSVSPGDAARAAMLATESIRLVATIDGADALQAHLAVTPRRLSSSSVGPGSAFAALSQDGRMSAAVDGHQQLSITSSEGVARIEKLGADIKAAQIALANDGAAFRIAGGRASVLGAQGTIDSREAETVLLSPDGTLYAGVYKGAQSEREVELRQPGKDEPSQRWTVRARSVPIAFSPNGAFFAFVNDTRVIVVDVAKGAVRESTPSDFNEITALAVDDSGDATLICGWKPDPAVIIRKNFQVQTLPTTGHSTFRRVYLIDEDASAVRSLAIDMKSGLVAIGGDRQGWVRIADYVEGNVIAVVRSDDLRAWTLTQINGAPVVVTANAGGMTTWAIERRAATAARPSIERAADIGPRAAIGAFADRFVITAMHKDEPRNWFLRAVPLSGNGDNEHAMPAAIESVMMSPVGGYVGLTDASGRREVRSLTSFQAVWEQPPEITSPLVVSFSPDDHFFAWGSAESGVWIVDLSTGRPRRLVEDASGLSGIAVAPDGSAVAWAHTGSNRGSADLTVSIWTDGGQVRSLGNLQARTMDAAPRLIFDRKGERLAAGIGEGMIRLWSPAGYETSSPLLHEDPLEDLSFSPDGQYLITRGIVRRIPSQALHEVVVWSIPEGRRLWRYLTEREIAGAAMSADGRYVFVAEEAALRSTGYLGIRLETLFWKSDDLVRIACARFEYRLSTDERAAFFPNISGKTACGESSSP
jgi:WD40 repeat protein